MSKCVRCGKPERSHPYLLEGAMHYYVSSYYVGPVVIERTDDTIPINEEQRNAISEPLKLDTRVRSMLVDDHMRHLK